MHRSASSQDPFEERVIAIYRETIDGLWAAVAGWTRGDRRLAEDLIQESWLRAVKHWRRRGIPEHPAAWLRVVARNLAVSHARRSGREFGSDDPEAVAGADRGTEPEAAAVDRVAVTEGLARLDARNAAMLHSFHLEGRSVREIANREALSERAVEGRLRRARLALRGWLGTEIEESKR
jgi:RNA polymerase sigma-70 factor (ECF subfamily)